MLKNKLHILFIILVLWMSSQLSFAQTEELRTLILTNVNFNYKWSGSVDGGYYKGLNDANYTRWGIRTIARYRINSTFRADLGFMINHVNSKDNGKQNEYRPHQTLLIGYPRLNYMTINHRVRVEEQFYSHTENADDFFNTRLRYELKTQSAFKRNNTIGPKTAYWMASTEVTFNILEKIKNNYKGVERLRTGIGLGYMISSANKIEATVYYQHTYSELSYADSKQVTIFNFYYKHYLFSKPKQK